MLIMKHSYAEVELHDKTALTVWQTPYTSLNTAHCSPITNTPSKVPIVFYFKSGQNPVAEEDASVCVLGLVGASVNGRTGVLYTRKFDETPKIRWPGIRVRPK